MRVFARRGFAVSTIRDTALGADSSIGSIYRHYATKEELCFDLPGRAVACLVTLAADSLEPGRQTPWFTRSPLVS
ncbi:helix-turn-helix domain-containing protein [Actinomadura verrucosospora]|uniref:helix-turn-helix domain-containing protein n=1 Tax=Actinomadura TaxID=1988 RepID=UPI003395D10E